MALRLNSLKTRTALAISLVIVVILVANAVYLILAKRRELREGIEARALNFALLTRQPLCAGYETYSESGFHRFGELVRDYMRIDPDVERIRIVSVAGEVLFDSAELDGTAARGPARESHIADPSRLDAIGRLEHTVFRDRAADGADSLEIVAPYVEDWGRHRLSVLYRVSYRSLAPGIGRLVYTTAGLTLFSIAVSVLVAAALASRITRPVEELTAGAKAIAEGNFHRRLSIRSGDELQILADAFNDMTERLKRNVEQLEESNEKLAAANEELKELDRLKSDLLANVSHELRTPLTAIKGYTEYILERKLGSVTDKQEKGLLVVQRNLERLSKSINALLDFSRMDVGRISLTLQPFNLAALVDQILTSLRSELERKGLTAAARLPPQLPPVIADREKMSQVIENLVINAVKFTAPGGRITVAAERSSRRPVVEISVSDTGIGIPADQIENIFNRFHQLDGSSTRRFGGVGLGLAIVKSILDAHGFPITVDSEERVGTTFRFSLPLVDRTDREAGRSRPDERTLLVAAADAPEAARGQGTGVEEDL
jgi:signal transduction histidine kinase